MKVKSIAVIGFGLVVGLLIFLGTGFYKRSRAYGEAERLVEVVWPLSLKIRDYVDEKEKRPTSLSDLQSVPHSDKQRLELYPYRFFGTGEFIFHVPVNKWYGLGVDEEGNPVWTGAKPGSKAGEDVD